MCGIVGYIGTRSAGEIILDGLRRLEYRGYDSAGIALISGQRIEMRRSAGKLNRLVKVLEKHSMEGKVGIGHTRWATHGKPSEENAHPHTDCTGRIVVVHNGIIENYLELKRVLQAEGHVFKSETDTEVLAHLVEKHFSGNLLDAVQQTLDEVRGAYALGVICIDCPKNIVVARKDAPLILGIGDGENFLASDIPALLPYTRRMIFLDQGDVAELSPGGVRIFDRERKNVERAVQNITWDAVQAEKGGFKHFMLKEIFEQPQTIQDTFRGRLFPEEGRTRLEEVKLDKAFLRHISKIYIVACGTSYHAGLVGKFLFENIARIPAEVDIASEFRYRAPVLDKNVLTIVISQSGETADTLAGMRLASRSNSPTLAVCNVVGSTTGREADSVLYTRCGPEIGVASTKAFTGQLTALYLLALDWARQRGTLPQAEISRLINEFWELPIKLNSVLAKSDEVRALARLFFQKKDFLFLGRHLNYPIALEGALKLKEISYIHAEGYPAGEMKHGPIALIDENMPVMAVATKSKVYEKILGNIEEARARGGIVIAITTEGDTQVQQRTAHQLSVPEVDEIFAPLINVVPLQLFAYHMSVLLGCDVDQPRNLAKSVTVE